MASAVKFLAIRYPRLGERDEGRAQARSPASKISRAGGIKMENIGRKDLLDLLEELRMKADWREPDPVRNVLEGLILLLLDGYRIETTIPRGQDTERS
jgi:hypothetical protein